MCRYGLVVSTLRSKMPKTRIVLLSVLPQVGMYTLPGDVDAVFYNYTKEWPSVYDKGGKEVRQGRPPPPPRRQCSIEFLL
jgi:hypothetical protein